MFTLYACCSWRMSEQETRLPACLIGVYIVLIFIVIVIEKSFVSRWDRHDHTHIFTLTGPAPVYYFVKMSVCMSPQAAAGIDDPRV